LDVFGSLFELVGEGVDGFDCDVDLPDGLVEILHGLHSGFRSVFLKLGSFVMKFGDFLGKFSFVEDFVTNE